MSLSPNRFPAGSFFVVAEFGFDDTNVAGGKALAAGITIPLSERLFDAAIATQTADLAIVAK
jgi:hypothetical protein